MTASARPKSPRGLPAPDLFTCQRVWPIPKGNSSPCRPDREQRRSPSLPATRRRRRGGNRTPSTLCHLSVAKLLLFSGGGGENPIRTPQTSPGRWGGGGSWATRVPRPAGLPSGERRARLRSRPAGAGVTWPARPASISRAEASLTRARGGGGDGGELGRAEGRLPAADRREGDAGARAGAAAGLTWR